MVSHPPSLSIRTTVRALVHRIRLKLTPQRRLDAPDNDVCSGTSQETSQRLLNNTSNHIVQDDPHDWEAVATGIRREVLEKASAHRELWDRVEALILNALENRAPGQTQCGD